MDRPTSGASSTKRGRRPLASINRKKYAMDFQIGRYSWYGEELEVQKSYSIKRMSNSIRVEDKRYYDVLQK